MAIITNEFLTYSAIGNREDLADVIYNIDPVECPFMSGIDKAKAKATLHEWQTQALAAAAQNAQLQGDEATFSAVTATVRPVNRTQISWKTVAVSGTQEAVDKAGRESEMVYQMVLKNKELRRDMEFDLTNNQTPTTGDSTTAQLYRPLPGWITTNDNRGTGGADGTTSAAVTNGTQRPLTETLMKTVSQNVWTQGGKPDTWMVGAFNKTVISGFTGNTTRMQDTTNAKLVSNIDVYRDDFGTKKIVANRFQRSRDAHLLQMDLWAIAYLRKPFTKDLAATGDSEKGMIIVEYTLEARNEKGSGGVYDLTTS